MSEELSNFNALWLMLKIITTVFSIWCLSIYDFQWWVVFCVTVVVLGLINLIYWLEEKIRENSIGFPKELINNGHDIYTKLAQEFNVERQDVKGALLYYLHDDWSNEPDADTLYQLCKAHIQTLILQGYILVKEV